MSRTSSHCNFAAHDKISDRKRGRTKAARALLANLGRPNHTQQVRSISYSTLYSLQQQRRRMKRERTETTPTTTTKQGRHCNLLAKDGSHLKGNCGLKNLKAANFKKNPADFHKLSSTIWSEHNAVSVSCSTPLDKRTTQNFEQKTQSQTTRTCFRNHTITFSFQAIRFKARSKTTYEFPIRKLTIRFQFRRCFNPNPSTHALIMIPPIKPNSEVLGSASTQIKSTDIKCPKRINSTRGIFVSNKIEVPTQNKQLTKCEYCVRATKSN